MSPEGVSAILENHNGNRGELIAILQDVQIRHGHLPEDALRDVSRHCRVPLTEVFHIATFYNSFSLEPRGRHLVRVCLGTACHVNGGQRIFGKVLRELNLPDSGTTPDFQFSVEPVRCIGCCGLAPVMRVDGNTHGHLRQAIIPKILKKYRSPATAPLAVAT